MQPVLVVAGNHREYSEWCSDNRKSAAEAVYCAGIPAIRSNEYSAVILTGTWRTNPLAYCDELVELEQRIRTKRRLSE